MGLMVMGLWALWAGLKPDEEASDTREEASGTVGIERKKMLVCLERKEKTCIFASQTLSYGCA